MKKILVVINYALFLMIGFSSCLKDDSAILKPEEVVSVVEFGDFQPFVSSASNPIRLYSTSFDISPLDSIIIPINYAGADMASKDINVKISYDSSVVLPFNQNEYGTTTASYVTAINPDYVTVSNAVIKAGTNRSSCLVTIKVDKIDFTHSYVIPLVLNDASGERISGNFSKMVIKVTPKNMLDGQYTVTGSYTDFALGTAATARYPKTINLITQSANSNGYFDINLNGGLYGYTFFNNGSGSYYGNFAAVFIFNESGTITGVTNYYGQTNSSNRSAEIDPAGVNKVTFSPDGKPQKLEVSYFMYQAGAKRLAINETFIYQHAR